MGEAVGRWGVERRGRLGSNMEVGCLRPMVAAEETGRGDSRTVAAGGGIDGSIGKSMVAVFGEEGDCGSGDTGQASVSGRRGRRPAAEAAAGGGSDGQVKPRWTAVAAAGAGQRQKSSGGRGGGCTRQRGRRDAAGTAVVEGANHRGRGGLATPLGSFNDW